MLSCFKLKHSVLPMIYVLKCDFQQFHVSSKLCVRRVLRKDDFSPKTSISESVDPTELNSYSNPVSHHDSNADFFGIESDAGVITLGTPQNKPVYSNKKPDFMEKYHKTSFGVVRYDVDNKLKYHGQYQKTIGLTFPVKNSESAEVSIYETESRSRSEYGSEIIFNDNEVSKSCESDSVEKTAIDESYIDEQYFGNVAKKDDITASNTNTYPSSGDLNFIDKNYFETLITSENFKSAENEFLEKRNTSYNDSQTSMEFNFVDKSNFESEMNEKELVSKDNVSHSTIQNVSYFDENYFKDFIPFIEKSLNVQKLESSPLNPEINNYKNEENLELGRIESFSKNAANTAENKKISTESHIFHEHEHRDEFSLNSIHDVKNKKATSAQPNMQINQNEDKLNKYTEQTFKKTLSHKFDSLAGISKVNAISKPVRQKVSNTAPSVQDAQPVSKMTAVKLSDEETKNISTAHDFVKKLREEKEIPQLRIRKEKGRKDVEKVDSKGFRILKNQVPDLTQFTRDEIFHLLKENIVYSDDDLLVLNKPYGLVIHDSKTTKYPSLSTFLDDLARELNKKDSNPKLFTVHRLDKETTGCLLLARNEMMAQYLKSLFCQRKIIKKYWIITCRVPNPPAGVIDMPIAEGSIDNRNRMVLHAKLPKDFDYRNHSHKGKEAITSYEVIAESGNAALVEVFPKTGIKHQIRVHFGFGLSCPILGDHKYSHLDKLAPQKLPSDILQRLKVRQSKVRHIPMHIHAKSISIPQYFENRDLFVNIRIPEHWKINMKRLKFRKK